jgi:DNA-binding transcriptional regulator YiaG
MPIQSYVWPAPSSDEIRKLRQRLNLSQAKFSKEFCIDLKSLQNWEQGIAVPESGSRQLLWMIAANSQAALSLIHLARKASKAR